MYSAQLGRQQLVWVGTWAVHSGQKGKESHENAFGRFGQMSRHGYSRMPSCWIAGQGLCRWQLAAKHSET